MKELNYKIQQIFSILKRIYTNITNSTSISVDKIIHKKYLKIKIKSVYNLEKIKNIDNKKYLKKEKINVFIKF